MAVIPGKTLPSHTSHDFHVIRQECIEWVSDHTTRSYLAQSDADAEASRIMTHCFGVALTLLKGSPLLLKSRIQEVSDVDFG